MVVGIKYCGQPPASKHYYVSNVASFNHQEACLLPYCYQWTVVTESQLLQSLLCIWNICNLLYNV